jgi:hypothetical protein
LFARKKRNWEDEILVWIWYCNLRKNVLKNVKLKKGRMLACYLSVFTFWWLRAGTIMVGCSFHWHFENV